MNKNETAARLTSAAGALERALERLERRPHAEDESALRKAGDNLVEALEAAAAKMDNRADAGNIYRITDSYGEKAAHAFGPGGYLMATKAGRASTVVDASGKCRVVFAPDNGKAEAYRDAANDMIIAARTVADRMR